eukprot:6077894-Alexandrium_andersonii.AAC.1
MRTIHEQLSHCKFHRNQSSRAAALAGSSAARRRHVAGAALPGALLATALHGAPPSCEERQNAARFRECRLACQTSQLKEAASGDAR